MAEGQDMASLFGEDSDSDDDMPSTNASSGGANSAGNIFGDSDSDSDSEDERRSRLKKKSSKKQKKEQKKEKRKRKEKRPHSPTESSQPRKKQASGNQSGDEYDSGSEVEENEDDRKFIEDDSDDDLGLTEAYGGKQDFRDDKPAGYDSDQEERRSKKSRSSSSSSHHRKANSDNPLDQALARIAAGKRRPKKESASDDRRLNETIAEFLESMDDGAKRDRTTHKNKEPAVEKLNMLPKVLKMMKNKPIQNNLLEMNLLAAVNEWLTPLDDGSLASHAVRVGLYDALMDMPVKVDHLQRSGLGKLIMGLWHHPKETKENKATLKSLIEKWARPVFNKSHRHVTGGEEAPARKAPERRPESYRTMEDSSSEVSLRVQSVGNEAVETIYGIVKSDRVAIPKPLNFNFKKSVGRIEVQAKGKKVDPDSRRGRLDKKLLLNGRAKKKNTERSVQCSIEGRGT